MQEQVQKRKYTKNLKRREAKRKESRDNLIQQVKVLSRELGKTPTSTQFKKDSRCASVSIVMYYFGSWNAFISEAGLKENVRTSIPKEKLIEQVQILTRELGRVPTSIEFSHDPRTVSRITVIKRFRSWNAFISEAGLKPKKLCTSEEMVEMVQKLAQQLGRVPTSKEFLNTQHVSYWGVAKYFGTWNNLLDASGLEKNRHQNITNDELIEQLLRLKQELGKTPTSAEFDKCSWTASRGTVFCHFGSWNNAIKQAGMKINRKRGLSREELIKQVQMLAKKINKTPTFADFSECPETASSGVVLRIFGSWNKFLELAGLQLNQKSKHTKDRV